MIPKMRRHKQQLPAEECVDILKTAPYGVLGTEGTDGMPYAVPISFAYAPAVVPDDVAGADATDDVACAVAPDDAEDTEFAGRLYLHCAATGHKLDALAANPHVCFTVVAQSEPVAEKLTDRFRSVMAFGIAHRAEGDEKLAGLRALGTKYAPGLEAMVEDEIEKAGPRTEVIVVDITDVTGKEGLELTRERRG